MEIDPVKYEVFLHRLWAIGEEGRMTLQRVTASPIVAQGGEVMSSFYDAEGKMVLACSGHLRFAGATSDAITNLIHWYSESPGFYDGDQIFFNDPYVAGSHTYDMMVIKPIFCSGELIAWTATSTHTADTGGVLRGAASEIFHEGIRILGVKVVEKGEFREDIFRTLTEQCRDPQYVGLDLKAMIAGNNVCGRRYLELLEKFGPEFIDAAGQKTIADSEEMARHKLRSLPDGQWVSRIYTTALDKKTLKAMPILVMCTATKKADQLRLDFAGSSPQMANDANSTLPSTMAHVGVALTNTLFWDVPWSDGKLVPVEVSVPEGSVLNCRFPAACGFAPWIGEKLVASVAECMAKILFAAGRLDDVNASWYGLWHAGGPGYFPGGTNREGIRTAQGIYDIHGGGLGATPQRDGVNTGGHANIPSGGISDVERIEMQYPLLYFTRNHNTDGPGAGKYRGGLGSFRVTMVYGSQDFTNDYKPYGGIPQGAYGLFGGYPVGCGVFRALFTPASDFMDRVRAGDYPTRTEQITEDGWGQVYIPEGTPERLSLPEFTVMSDFTASGGGFGDPLDRDPEKVARDVRIHATSERTAREIYGVVLTAEDFAVDARETSARRQEIRDARLKEGELLRQSPFTNNTKDWQSTLRMHEYLEIASDGHEQVIRCTRCGYLFCDPQENYKKYSLRRVMPLEEIAGRSLPSGEDYLGRYHMYVCPGCATLLQVDVFCPALGGDEDLMDIRIDGVA
jgi:N-methylhydantoinase B